MSKISYVPSPTKIKVIGLVGAGCNVVTKMVREQIQGVEFIAIYLDSVLRGVTLEEGNRTKWLRRAGLIPGFIGAGMGNPTSFLSCLAAFQSPWSLELD